MELTIPAVLAHLGRESHARAVHECMAAMTDVVHDAEQKAGLVLADVQIRAEQNAAELSSKVEKLASEVEALTAEKKSIAGKAAQHSVALRDAAAKLEEAKKAAADAEAAATKQRKLLERAEAAASKAKSEGHRKVVDLEAALRAAEAEAKAGKEALEAARGEARGEFRGVMDKRLMMAKIEHQKETAAVKARVRTRGVGLGRRVQRVERRCSPKYTPKKTEFF